MTIYAETEKYVSLKEFLKLPGEDYIHVSYHRDSSTFYVSKNARETLKHLDEEIEYKIMVKIPGYAYIHTGYSDDGYTQDIKEKISEMNSGKTDIMLSFSYIHATNLLSILKQIKAQDNYLYLKAYLKNNSKNLTDVGLNAEQYEFTLYKNEDEYNTQGSLNPKKYINKVVILNIYRVYHTMICRNLYHI